MKLFSIILAVGFVIILALLYLSNQGERSTPVEQTEETRTDRQENDTTVITEYEQKPDLIRVQSLAPGQAISTPVTITGEARGYWYFEASFPVQLVNWDGLIIAEGYATAQEEWMTEEFVPFSTTLDFTSPYRVDSPDFMKRGWLILQKDNPSGLPEHDDALEFPVTFTAIE